MIECRSCRETFEGGPERIGARCPNCRAPLFDRPERRRGGIDLGPCGRHPDNDAFGRCRNCQQLMCSVCRTRWQDRLVCADCLSRMLEDGEAVLPETRIRRRQVVWGFLLAVAGWAMFLAMLFPLGGLLRGGPDATLSGLMKVLFFGSLLPAAAAVGLSTAVLVPRARGRRWAAWSLAMGAAQVGLMTGLLALNWWWN